MSEQRQCTATSTRSGKRCRKAPIKGGTVCLTHGGSTPQVQAAARGRVIETRLRGELARTAWEPVTDPIGFFQDVAGEVRAWLELCRGEVARLREMDYTDARLVQDVRPSIALYERALDRAAKTADGMVARGIEAAALRREEAAAQVAADWLIVFASALLDEAGVRGVDRGALMRRAKEVADAG